MPTYSLILRNEKGSKLTATEMDNNLLYLEDIALSSSGPQGTQGPEGPEGKTGSIGSQGPRGATGSQGPIGVTGSQGPIGLQGPTGSIQANLNFTNQTIKSTSNYQDVAVETKRGNFKVVGGGLNVNNKYSLPNVKPRPNQVLNYTGKNTLEWSTPRLNVSTENIVATSSSLYGTSSLTLVHQGSATGSYVEIIFASYSSRFRQGSIDRFFNISPIIDASIKITGHNGTVVPTSALSATACSFIGGISMNNKCYAPFITEKGYERFRSQNLFTQNLFTASRTLGVSLIGTYSFSIVNETGKKLLSKSNTTKVSKYFNPSYSIPTVRSLTMSTIYPGFGILNTNGWKPPMPEVSGIPWRQWIMNLLLGDDVNNPNARDQFNSVWDQTFGGGISTGANNPPGFDILELPTNSDVNYLNQDYAVSTCNIDADCPIGFMCVNGECIPNLSTGEWFKVGSKINGQGVYIGPNNMQLYVSPKTEVNTVPDIGDSNNNAMNYPCNTCDMTAECPPGMICVDGYCISQIINSGLDTGLGCTIDGYCPDGFICQDGLCVPDLQSGLWTLIGEKPGGMPYYSGPGGTQFHTGWDEGEDLTILECEINSDCPSGYVCVGGYCVLQIITSNLSSGLACQIDGGCPEGFYCLDGECIPDLASGLWVEIGQKPGGYPIYQGPGGVELHTGWNDGEDYEVLSCNADDECPVGYVCVDGYCIREVITSALVSGLGCSLENDLCPNGFVCSNYQCVPDLESGLWTVIGYKPGGYPIYEGPGGVELHTGWNDGEDYHLSAITEFNSEIILGGGYPGVTANGGTTFSVGFLSKLLNNGTRNINFYSDYFVSESFSSDVNDLPGQIIHTVVTDNSGRILVGGLFEQYDEQNIPYLIRINNSNDSGTIDNTFVMRVNGPVRSIVVLDNPPDPDDYIIAGEFTGWKESPNDLSFTTANRIVRVSSTGGVDSTFLTNIGTGFNNKVFTIKLSEDKTKIFVGGDFTSFNGISCDNFIVLNVDGTLNTTASGFNGRVNTIYEDTLNNTLIIGGNFTQYNGVTYNRIIRLGSDYDTPHSQNFGDGFNGNVFDITKAPSGTGIFENRILVTGDFTTYNNVSIRKTGDLTRLGKREIVILNDRTSISQDWSLDSNFLINAEGDFAKALTVNLTRSVHGEGGTQSIMVIGRISSIDSQPVNGVAMLNTGDKEQNFSYFGENSSMRLPILIKYDDLYYDRMYLHSDSYITFGTPNKLKSPVIYVGYTSSRSFQRVYAGMDYTAENPTFIARYEGGSTQSLSLSAQPQRVWEFHFTKFNTRSHKGEQIDDVSTRSLSFKKYQPKAKVTEAKLLVGTNSGYNPSVDISGFASQAAWEAAQDACEELGGNVETCDEYPNGVIIFTCTLPDGTSVPISEEIVPVKAEPNTGYVVTNGKPLVNKDVKDIKLNQFSQQITIKKYLDDTIIQNLGDNPVSLGIDVPLDSVVVIDECIVEVFGAGATGYSTNQQIIIGDGVSNKPQIVDSMLTSTQSRVYKSVRSSLFPTMSLVKGQSPVIRSGTAVVFSQEITYGNPTLPSSVGSGLNASFNLTISYHLTKV